MRFSATVMLLNGRGIWKLRAMPRRVRMCGCNRVMSSSRNTTVPASVRNAPEMQLISVVLPEPFGPIRPKRSPGTDIDADIVERDEAAEAFGQR